MKILIVEDDEEMCAELGHVLTEEGHYVTSCNNGEECLRTVKEAKYDIILLDIKMPKMNGCEVLKHLKGSHPSTKVLVLTGSPVTERDWMFSVDQDARREALKLADGMMNKPFDVDSVLDWVKKAGG